MMHVKVIAKTIVSAATLAGGLGLAAAAQAAPLSPAMLGVTDAAVIERVAGGCGPGFHPNPWGVCRPNFYGPRPYWGGPYYGRPYAYGYGPRPIYRPYGYARPFY